MDELRTIGTNLKRLRSSVIFSAFVVILPKIQMHIIQDSTGLMSTRNYMAENHEFPPRAPIWRNNAKVKEL